MGMGYGWGLVGEVSCKRQLGALVYTAVQGNSSTLRAYGRFDRVVIVDAVIPVPLRSAHSLFSIVLRRPNECV